MILKKKEKKNARRGFTLIELMVVVAIMLIMTGVIFFNYNSFNDSMLLTNSAYDLSLSIRQAQVYGTAVREGTGWTPVSPIDANSYNNFAYAYGMHFDTSDPTGFSLFVDNGSANGAYDPGVDSKLQTYVFQRGIKVEKLCVSYNGAPCYPVTSLDITFLRPNPESRISASDTATSFSCDPINNPVCGSATIILQNANGSMTKAVVVSPTGQISVKNDPTP